MFFLLLQTVKFNSSFLSRICFIFQRVKRRACLPFAASQHRKLEHFVKIVLRRLLEGNISRNMNQKMSHATFFVKTVLIKRIETTIITLHTVYIININESDIQLLSCNLKISQFFIYLLLNLLRRLPVTDTGYLTLV